MTTPHDNHTNPTTIDELDSVGRRVAPTWALVLYPDPLVHPDYPGPIVHDNTPALPQGLDLVAVLARSWFSQRHPIPVAAPAPTEPTPTPTRWPVAVPLAELGDVLEYQAPWWAELHGTVVSYLPAVAGLAPKLGGNHPTQPERLGEAVAGWAGLLDVLRTLPTGLVADNVHQARATLVYCGMAPGDLDEVVEAAEACGVPLATATPTSYVGLSRGFRDLLEVVADPKGFG